MIALKMTALQNGALRRGETHDVERRNLQETSPRSIAGMIAKYFATSLAMLKVVSAPRVIRQLLADLDDLDELGRVRVEIDHVARFLGGLRAGVHRHADIGLGERGRVVGAVAGHRDEVARLLLLADECELVLRRGLGEEVIDARLLARSPRQ